jgi:hypothetical protein
MSGVPRKTTLPTRTDSGRRERTSSATFPPWECAIRFSVMGSPGVAAVREARSRRALAMRVAPATRSLCRFRPDHAKVS